LQKLLTAAFKREERFILFSTSKKMGLLESAGGTKAWEKPLSGVVSPVP